MRPGCDLLQSLEEILNGILGKLREAAGQEAMKALDWSNTPRIMAECGSKGSPLNISQMMACVGQQAVGGMRIQDGFVNRTLPHFEYHSLTPPGKIITVFLFAAPYSTLLMPCATNQQQRGSLQIHFTVA